MRKFIVDVSGTEYEVTIKEVTNQGKSPARPSIPVIDAGGNVKTEAPKPAAPKAESVKEAAPEKAAQKEQEPVQKADKDSAGCVCAPMPGNVLEVCVKAGDSVSAGQNLIILEAMKMENEIKAAGSGIVKEVHVHKSETVETGAPLVTIE